MLITPIGPGTLGCSSIILHAHDLCLVEAMPPKIGVRFRHVWWPALGSGRASLRDQRRLSPGFRPSQDAEVMVEKDT